MSTAPLVHIAGSALMGPVPRIDAPLDDLIFKVTSAALEDAGLRLDDVGAVYTASSDLLDGRAISTMTLTASTGSFAKHEMKVCDDGLGALALAADGVRAGIADVALVTSWSKLSEASLEMIAPLAADPAFHRPLGMTDPVANALQKSKAEGRATQVSEHAAPGGDVATCLVIARDAPLTGEAGRILGAGWSSGPYLTLRPDYEPLQAVTEAVARALEEAALDNDAVVSVHCGGFFDVTDEALTHAARVGASVARISDRLELGYATGLVALDNALAQRGPALVLGRAGLGTTRAYAVLVEGGFRA